MLWEGDKIILNKDYYSWWPRIKRGPHFVLLFAVESTNLRRGLILKVKMFKMKKKKIPKRLNNWAVYLSSICWVLFKCSPSFLLLLFLFIFLFDVINFSALYYLQLFHSSCFVSMRNSFIFLLVKIKFLFLERYKFCSCSTITIRPIVDWLIVIIDNYGISSGGLMDVSHMHHCPSLHYLKKGIRSMNQITFHIRRWLN